MAWVYKRLDEIESLVCHLCREEIGKMDAGLIQINPGPNENVTTGLYHDKCFKELEENRRKMEIHNG